jgi:hypothetical protein
MFYVFGGYAPKSKKNAEGSASPASANLGTEKLKK